MASFIYNSFWYDLATGAIDIDTDTFKVLLIASTYPASDETAKDSDLKRSAVSNECPATGNYATGGNSATFTATKDTANNRLDISCGGTSWSSSTISATKAVYYKARGGASTADELVCLIDFGGTVATTNGTFTLTASTVRIQN